MVIQFEAELDLSSISGAFAFYLGQEVCVFFIGGHFKNSYCDADVQFSADI